MVLSLLLPATALSAAERVPVGYTSVTDIQTVIDAYDDFRPILCYYFHDTLFVRAKDLAKYEFNVEMDENANKLTLTLLTQTNSRKPDSPYTYDNAQTIKAAISTSLPVYSTDTTVIFKGIPVRSSDGSSFVGYSEQQVEAYELNGDIIVPISTMEKMNGNWPGFSYEERKLYISFMRANDPANWGALVQNPGYNSNVFQLKGPATFQMERDGNDWKMANTAGDWAAIDSMWLTNGFLYFSSHTYVDFEYKDQLVACSNFTNQKRTNADTPARRAALAKVLRVYINGEQIGGELVYQDDPNIGNGMQYAFWFYFDRSYAQNDVQTVRVEFGPAAANEPDLQKSESGIVTKTITATFGATKYVLDGIPLQAESLVYNDTAYFPAAYLAQQLGCATSWDAATNTTTVTTGKGGGQPVAVPAPIASAGPVTKTIAATFGATKYILDGVPLTEDSLVYNGIAYYPAAYLAQKLGCSISWDAKTNVTTVTSGKK